MAYTDLPFPYGPFVPHHIPKQYIENYFSVHRTDSFLQLNTTVEDLSRITSATSDKADSWKLTLRKHDPIQNVDVWWEEYFDAVILANGHYTIPYVSELYSVMLRKSTNFPDSPSQGIGCIHREISWSCHPF